jgi:sRNA-binding protein
MTSEPTETPAQAALATPAQDGSGQAGRLRSVQAVLEQLFKLYPQLFGAEFLPLKLGIFQELLASHPDVFERHMLKAALGVHTRSTRYLQCVAAGMARHDLQGGAVDAVAPEHIYLAMLELFRRRQSRSAVDLRPKFCTQLTAAFVASGLSRQDYLIRAQTKDAEANSLLELALDEHEQKLARQEALRRAFGSSGKTPEEFAAMYGLNKRDVSAALAQG